jgi:hypothetical protein
MEINRDNNTFSRIKNLQKLIKKKAALKELCK